MKEFLRKTKNVKRGTILKEADVDSAWLAAYARIARRCRDDNDMGVTRYSCELAPRAGVRSLATSGQSAGTWCGTLAYVYFA
jgi:hypothetical protein